jgi:hypothetical protein
MITTLLCITLLHAEGWPDAWKNEGYRQQLDKQVRYIAASGITADYEHMVSEASRLAKKPSQVIREELREVIAQTAGVELHGNVIRPTA